MEEQTNQQPQNTGGAPAQQDAPKEQDVVVNGDAQKSEEDNPPKEKNAGSVAGIVIIVLVLVLGGLYFWGKRLTEEQATKPDSQTETASVITPSDDTGVTEDLGEEPVN